MPQPIVPVEIPTISSFDSKRENDILLKIRIGKFEVSFSISQSRNDRRAFG